MELQLRRIRRSKELSQQQLADSLGVDVKTIGNWERGTTLMNIEQVWNCAEALGSSPNDICGWYTEHPEDLSEEPAITDPQKREISEAYDSMNRDGRSSLLTMARGLAMMPENQPGGEARSQRGAETNVA